MRIAYVCSDLGVPICGTKGASVHVRSLSQALRDLGHDILILTPRAGGEPPDEFSVPIEELAPDPYEERAYDLLRADPLAGRTIARDVRAMRSATSLHRGALPLLHEFHPDLIYERYSLFGTAGLALARDLRVPLMLEVNAPLCDEQAQHRGLAFDRTARGIEHLLLRSADRVIAVSEGVRCWLEGLGVDPSRLTMLPNAAEPRRFSAAEPHRHAMRAQLGLTGQPVVGFLGTLKPWHGVATLIRAIATLRRQGLTARLLVVGDGPERARLEDLARRESLAASATFTGAVPHERVPLYLAAMDVAVAPYEHADDFYFSPLKLFEYLAAGRAVVAADVGQIRHCVRPGRSGLLYLPGDAAALAEAISSLVQDRARALGFGREGQRHVRAHHTWERNARAVVELARPLIPALARAS